MPASRRFAVSAFALLHTALLLAAPVADALRDSGLILGPHIEEVRGECVTADDHFCCAFCRLLAPQKPPSVESRPRNAHTIRVESFYDADPGPLRSGVMDSRRARAPPRSMPGSALFQAACRARIASRCSAAFAFRVRFIHQTMMPVGSNTKPTTHATNQMNRTISPPIAPMWML